MNIASSTKMSRTDVLSPRQRSYCMSRIKGKDTGPEMSLRKVLWKAGLRYRIHYRLPGKPDIVFPRARLVVFVDGCFWHMCPLHLTLPKANRHFWQKKLLENVGRDKKNGRRLRQQGWKIMRFWEHEVRSDVQHVAVKIIRDLNRQPIRLSRTGQP